MIFSIYILENFVMEIKKEENNQTNQDKQDSPIKDNENTSLNEEENFCDNVVNLGEIEYEEKNNQTNIEEIIKSDTNELDIKNITEDIKIQNSYNSNLTNENLSSLHKPNEINKTEEKTKNIYSSDEKNPNNINNENINYNQIFLNNQKLIEKKRANIFKKTDITQGASYDFIFKIALIGDSGIGKTSILIRFVEDVFKDDTTSTIGVDFKLVSFKIDEKLAKMQIWDTCGSERFKSLTSSFIKSCTVFVLAFDLTKQKSFLNLENWIKLIKENVNPKLLCLVGNKCDLPELRQVTLDDAIKFSNKHELKYLETSAKTNFGIENLFSYIAEKLYDDTVRSRNSGNENNVYLKYKKGSRGFELGPSSNIEGERNKENDSDEEDKDEKRKLKRNKKCNC